jgi:hypothetical protein
MSQGACLRLFQSVNIFENIVSFLFFGVIVLRAFPNATIGQDVGPGKQNYEVGEKWKRK